MTTKPITLTITPEQLARAYEPQEWKAIDEMRARAARIRAAGPDYLAACGDWDEPANDRANASLARARSALAALSRANGPTAS